jgi:phosphatidylglycerol---prolipoprotein diacylglyceryl transferase
VIGLTAAQLESLTLFVIGAAWIAIVVRRHGSILLPEGERRRRAQADVKVGSAPVNQM